MSKNTPLRYAVAFGGSIILHLLLIGSILYSVSHIHISPKAPVKTISINHVTLQKQTPPPPAPKPKPKPLPPKPEPIVKKKPKPLVKKRRVKKRTPPKRLKPRKRVSRQKSVSKEPETPRRVSKTAPSVPAVKPQPKATAATLYLDENLPRIIEAIEKAKYYPKIARRMHLEGTVKVSFVLERDGSVHDIIAEGEQGILKKAAKTTIRRASLHFPRPPHRMTISVPIVYRLK